MSSSEKTNSKECSPRHRHAQSISYPSRDNLQLPIPAYTQPQGNNDMIKRIQTHILILQQYFMSPCLHQKQS